MDLVARAKGMLLSPKSEWDVVAGEPMSVAALYSGWIIPMAAIPAVCGFIGFSIVGTSILGTSWRRPMAAGLESAVLNYVLSLVMIYVVGMIINALAPNFGGEKDQVQALKVAAYSATASWVGGIFTLLPALAIIAVLFALYSLYLLFLGLPRLMKAPEDKAVGYTVVVVLCVIVLGVVIGAVSRYAVPGMTPDFSVPRP
jgi:hypothetical protein